MPCGLFPGGTLYHVGKLECLVASAMVKHSSSVAASHLWVFQLPCLEPYDNSPVTGL